MYNINCQPKSPSTQNDVHLKLKIIIFVDQTNTSDTIERQIKIVLILNFPAAPKLTEGCGSEVANETWIVQSFMIIS